LNDKTIAFVGLGAMGAHSARRLATAGFRVQGYDLRREALQALTEAGGHATSSLAEAIAGADHALLFVVNGKQAEQVIFGPGGFGEAGKAGLTIMSCVTMSPGEAASLGKRCAEKGWRFIDSPVSGGTAGAERGTLTIMAAGTPAAIEDCRPFYEAIGKRLMIVGGAPGQGAMVKTINQLLCGVHLAAAGEAMAMAERAGLDLQAVWEVVNYSAAGSWMMNDRGPRMVAKSFDAPTSAVDIFVKDLGIVVDVAREMHFPAPLAATALQSFLGASGAGNGRRDDSAVMLYYAGFSPEKPET
jgi:3-hydroxyisobutyrate dehydrogenase